MKKIFPFLVCMILLVTGCANKNTVTKENAAHDDVEDTAYNVTEIITEINETEMLIDATADSNATLPPYVYSGDD